MKYVIDTKGDSTITVENEWRNHVQLWVQQAGETGMGMGLFLEPIQVADLIRALHMASIDKKADR